MAHKEWLTNLIVELRIDSGPIVLTGKKPLGFLVDHRDVPA
jgi:hypothetical protein